MALASATIAYDEGLFWYAHTLLEKTEPIFLKVQNTKHMYYLCDADRHFEPPPPSARNGDRESVFNISGGTDQWSNEDRDRLSSRVQDFCYYGYMAALAYRTRLLDSEVPGVMEGRATAMMLLRALLSSRSNALDFMNSAGWAISHKAILQHLYPPAGPRAETLDPGLTLDDTERPLEEVLGLRSPWRFDLRTGCGTSGHRRKGAAVRVAVLGYHTSLALELVSVWNQHLWNEFFFEVAGHILEPGVGTAEEVAKGSLCKDFHNGAFCAWDARLLALNKRYVGRGRLPIAGLPSPRIDDVEAFLNDFAAAFGGGGDRLSLPAGAAVDRRIDAADLFVCTEPAVLCGAVSRAFPDRPAIGYFANPLTSYLPSQSALAWVAEFAELVSGGDAPAGPRRSAPFMAVASTRFLAEQMRLQAGRPVLTARPLAAYLGPPRGWPKHRESDVLVLRMPSVFWHSACIMNTLVRLNAEILAEAHVAGGRRGIRVPGMHFIASEEVKDGASEAFAGFQAVMIWPYDVSQMRLYEFYAMALPILVPSRSQLPSYLYRGLTTIDDFNHVLPGALEAAREATLREGRDGPTHLDYNPFDRADWQTVAMWAQLTHWFTLPHLLHFESAAEALILLAQEDLREVSAGMRLRQAQDLVKSVNFWRASLGGLGL